MVETPPAMLFDVVRTQVDSAAQKNTKINLYTEWLFEALPSRVNIVYADLFVVLNIHVLV